jgi:hypothetical protein
MPKLFIFLFLFSLTLQAQTVTGIVADSLNQPLENANVIAKPLQEKASLKFSIADHKGWYKLELEKDTKYEIKVSYIGYHASQFIFEANSPSITHNFILKPTNQQLKEVIITHKYEPVVVKKDTLTYSVNAFTNGTERKLKDQLAKLPGVEVSKDGKITVQGKQVSRLMVEDKPFFGGGTKLGVVNIPADAVDKIEVIDNFNEVGFLKQVSDSEELIMNVKLKEDKKKFVFGDVQAGKGNEDFYLGHTALFYYSSKTNLNLIADANNIGERTFSFEDLMRFQGGVSQFISGRKSLGSLYHLSENNRDLVKNISYFSAFSIDKNLFQKLDVNSYFLWSKALLGSQNDSQLQYIQTQVQEIRNQTGNQDNQSLLGNIKLDYSPNKLEKWYYNAQISSSNNQNNSVLNSVSAVNSTFKTLQDSDNFSLKQYLEFHKQFNKKNTLTFAVNHAFEKVKPINLWFSDQPFLAGFIPVVNDVNYEMQQIKNTQQNSIDAILKHYFIVNNYNHIYTILGNNYSYSTLETLDQQFLSNGTINNFGANGFNNLIKYQLNDAFVGLEYKFKIGNLTSKPSIYLHQYNLQTIQNGGTQFLQKTLWEPQFITEYEINSSESIRFNYKLSNDFRDAGDRAANFRLQSFNSLFKGNALLENEQRHNATLFYRKSNMYKGLNLYVNANYSRKNNTIRNEIELEGINRYSTPVQTANPETNWSMSADVRKKIYRFTWGILARANGFEYIQTLNNNTATYLRNAQTVGVNVRTSYKKWPFLELNYRKTFNQLKGTTNSSFDTENFDAKLDFEITTSWNLKTDYEYFANHNQSSKTSYQLANAALVYQKKESAFTFEFRVNNISNNNSLINNSFSDFIISSEQTFILPRVMMFMVNYKL